jgi:hypothetical protein
MTENALWFVVIHDEEQFSKFQYTQNLRDVLQELHT